MTTSSTSFKPEVKYSKKGNPVYIIAMTLAAALGGLLFGYDTADVNGAERSLVELFITNILNPLNHEYTIKLISHITGQ